MVKKNKSLLATRKYRQKNPVFGKHKSTVINPFTDSIETDLGKYGKLYTGNRRTDLQTGGGTNTFTRKIEREAENRKIDVDTRREKEAFQKKRDAIKGRGYKGPLADVADKYLGPIVNPIGDAIEKTYFKTAEGLSKAKRKVTKKAKQTLKKLKKKKKEQKEK